jgi:lipid A 3-O-deacylase
MKNFKLIAAVTCAAFMQAQLAHAQVTEVRVGVTEFDERTTGLSVLTAREADENSIALNAEIVFEEPKFLKWALSPQPYINGTLNVQGKTSFGGAGLLWRQNLGKTFYADFAFGGVIHNGTKDLLFSDVFDEINRRGNISLEEEDRLFDALARRFETEIEFGSRLLFREQITLGVRLSEDWATEVFYEHLSNAGLPENGENDGVNNLGVKLARRF